MVIRARAPLRLGLAGGGTDVSPFNEEHGGRILNTTIDKYAYAYVDALTEGFEFRSPDRDRAGKSSTKAIDELSADFPLHVAVYKRLIREFNDGEHRPLSLSTQVDAPAGSGLGSSSALVVAMVAAVAAQLKLSLGRYEIAQLAWQIEREDVGLAGGWQDQYAAAFGGFNYMEYRSTGRVIVNPLRVRRDMVSELEASLLLYYGGVSRNSANIIADQQRNVLHHVPTAVAANHAVRVEAETMKDHLVMSDLQGLITSMRAGWEAKKLLSSHVTTDAIEKALAVAASHGMMAGKVSGAGGGGFILMLVDPTRRLELSRVLERECGGVVMTCHFSATGVEVWASPTPQGR